ncbi:hypothetical protein C8J56DRAFT_533259 [Mycena floridula]|nr:hypothetical protein C8J56DRAFT_533259 [Mycena floridula]
MAEKVAEESPAPLTSSNRPRRGVRPTTQYPRSVVPQPEKQHGTHEQTNGRDSEAHSTKESPRNVAASSATAAEKFDSPNPLPLPRRSRIQKDSSCWNHPDEMVYPVASDWPDAKIFEFLVANVLGIPARSTYATNLFEVPCKHGTVQLPYRYRVPLLWTAKYLWVSVKLVMTAVERQAEWDAYRLSILYIAKICATLLESAHEAALATGIDKKWTCPTFDRMLVRFRRGYLMNDPSTVEKFWNTYGEEEYESDVLKCHWGNWALKGQSGFHLTAQESAKGVTKEEFLQGLMRKDGEWTWDTAREPPATFALQPIVSTAPAKELFPDFTMGSLGSLTPPPSDRQPSPAVKEEPAPAVLSAKPPRPSPQLPKRSIPPTYVAKAEPPKESQLLWASAPVPANPAAPKPSNIVPPTPIPLPAVAPSRPEVSAPTRQLQTASSTSNLRPVTSRPIEDLASSSPSPMPLNPSLARLQAQIDDLRSGIRILKEEQEQTEEENRALRSEHSASQYELRTLKRKLSGSFSAISANKRLQSGSQPSSSLSSISSASQYTGPSVHPLIHLIDADVLSDTEDETPEVEVVMVKPDPDVFSGWAGPLKSQRKLQKLRVP